MVGLPDCIDKYDTNYDDTSDLFCRVSKKGPNSIFEILEILVPKFSSHCPLHDDIYISSLFYTQIQI